MNALTADRIRFSFTTVFHYLFPQLTTELALLVVILKSVVLRISKDEYNQAAHSWGGIFAINFIAGVAAVVDADDY